MARNARSAAADLAKADVYTDDERALVTSIGTFVEAQAKKLEAMAEPMLRVDEDSL